MVIRLRIIFFGLLISVALSFYAINHLTWKDTGCCNESFVMALARHASPDRFVVLALVDTSFADMAINLYESSLKPHGIENFLFVGAGERACRILSNASLPCFRYTEDKATDVASTYKSPDFNRKMNIRTDMILEALEAGFTVLHTDLDVAFLRNPIPDLKVTLLTADLAALFDSLAYNAGFVAIRPTWFSKQIYTIMRSITRMSAKTDDQMAMNTAIKRLKGIFQNEFKPVTLDRSRYLCGVEYFERGDRLFSANCTDCFVVHNNWIVSREAKIYRFREHLMWFYDKHSYYSNANRGYLTYGNPVIWNDGKTSVSEELEALKAALAIGEILNRVVILPRFHCDISLTRKIQIPRSNSHTMPYKDCPLNCILKMTAFDKVFADLYRESSFLEHPLVPAEVKSDVISVLDLVRRRTSDGQSVTSTTPHWKALTADEVTRWFASEKKILRFDSLYRVTLLYPGEMERSRFEMKVKRAFQRGAYRQF